MNYTVSLFKHFYHNLPPLLPSEVKEKINESLNGYSFNPPASPNEVEEAMVTFGYDVWPWQKAHQDYLTQAEEKFAEHFFTPKLNSELLEKYNNFKLYGGTVSDLKSGNAVINFTPEERLEIAKALVELKNDLKNLTERQIMSLEKANYLKQVAKYSRLLIDIKKIIWELKELAKQVEHHPSLAGEIMERARYFEHGLCSLGPELNERELETAQEFFMGRCHELNRLKGINLSQAVNFFAQVY